MMAGFWTFNTTALIVKDKNFLFLRCDEFLLRTKNLPS